ncbi:hypothetical protein GCM10009584_20640 [Ornithinimicrobium humiphilum]|uniref:Uncharacterized protein n=1 Tax=Ornithinimicrobium humiphilum TaxID=125288 RepID=A0A543KNI3_9MICO|nr:hypothetical protein [Ornithinimicrobium humiphilum]TQM96637.1 hypothetical protein FB476_1513 [Ornithinimicrobium humiphilum]
MTIQSEPVPFNPTDEQAREIFAKLGSVAVEERPYADKVVDPGQLDLTDEQLTWALQAGYAYRGWDGARLFLPRLAKVYAYQPGTPDEFYHVDVALDRSFSPGGGPGSDAHLLRLGRAAVEHRDDTIVIKAYTATGAADVDHSTARTAHLVVEGVAGLKLLDRGYVEAVGFLTESRMYPTGQDTEIAVERDGSTYLCESCSTPHAFTDHWLPPSNLVSQVIKVKVTMFPATS